MIRKFLICALIFTSGCSFVANKKTTSFLDDFQQSGSMCIDALSVNLAKANCLEINSTEPVPDKNLFYVRCVSSAEGYQDHDWNQMVFVVVQNKDEHSVSLLGDNEVFCIDSKTILGVVLPVETNKINAPNKRYLF